MKITQRRTILSILLILTALSYWAISFQIRESRILYYDKATNQEWENGNPIKFEWGEFGSGYRNTDRNNLVHVTNKGESEPIIVTDLPGSAGGYSLYLAIRDPVETLSPKIRVLCNETELAFLTPHNADLQMDDGFVWEIPIADSVMDDENTLSIVNEWGVWYIAALYLPHLQLERLLQWLSPLLACFSIWFVARHVSSGAAATFLILAFAFPLYCHSYLFAKIMPLQGLYFSDSRELIRHISTHDFTTDISKHPVFLPIMNGLESFFHIITRKSFRAYLYAFTFVSSLNIAVSWRLLCLTPLPSSTRALCLLVYMFSFSVLTYASIYETLILTTALSTLTLLAAIKHRERPGKLQFALLTLCGSLTILASYVAGVFVLLAAWLALPSEQAGSPTRLRQRFLFTTCLTAFSLVGSCIVLLLILSVYVPDATLLERLHYFSIRAMNSQSSYSSIQNFSPENVIVVFLSLILKSVVNFSHSSSLLHANPTAPMWIKCANMLGWLCALLLLASAALGCLKSRYVRQRTLWFSLLALGPYILFHVYFNPSEMLLYAVPVLLVLLTGQAVAAKEAIGSGNVNSILRLILVLQVMAAALL